MNSVFLFIHKSEEERRIWNKAIPRADKILEMTNTVCEVHFQYECVDKTYKTVLPDGTLFVMERGRPLLKPGSIPTLFPNLPKYLSSTIKKRKPPMQRFAVPKKPKSTRVIEKTKHQSTSIGFSETNNEIPKTSLTFVDIKNGLKCIKLPNESWASCCTNLYIIFSRWKEIQNDITVAIGLDLSIKVIFENNYFSIGACLETLYI